jgi:hypothetical protein
MATVHRLVPPKPVPAAGGLPAGITVHSFGEVVDRIKPRNLLEFFAMCDDRDWVAGTLIVTLQITKKDCALANLPSAAEWKRLPVPARLQFIGDWLRAECFELMDFVSFDKPDTMTIGD